MQYLLDTNAWIVYLKDPNSSIRSKLASISPQQVVTCSVVLSESLHGAEKYGNRLQRLDIIKSLLTHISMCAIRRSRRNPLRDHPA
jgi:tRNA(fMet)-specific endonuclease VapC